MASRFAGDIGVWYVRRLGGWDRCDVFLGKEQCNKVDAEGAVNSSVLSPEVFWVPLEARLLLAWKDPKSVCGLCLLQKGLLWRRPGARTHGSPTPLIV